MSKKVEFDPSVKTALDNARAEANGPQRYVVLGYASDNPSKIVVISEGEGFLNEAIPHLIDTDPRYIYLRKDLKVEMAKTVKLAYIDWQPTSIPVRRRTAVREFSKAVQDFVKPFHIEMQASERKELDEEALNHRIGSAAGTASHVRDSKGGGGGGGGGAASPTTEAAPKVSDVKAAFNRPAPKADAPKAAGGGHSGGSFGSGAGAGSNKVTFLDEDAFKSELKKVKDDKSETNWILVKWEGKDKLSVLGSGTGGVTELATKLEPDNVNFGLVRVIELVDGKSRTTKFVFIKWQPSSEAIKPMVRAAIGMKDPAIKAMFGMFHVDFVAETTAELTDERIMNLVGAASGTRSNVREAKPAHQ